MATPFRIREDSKLWFNHIDRDSKDPKFNTDFDILYFCFMASLAVGGRKEDRPVSETRELVDYYPDRYKSRGRHLVALFLKLELDRLGIAMDEKEAVHEAISRLVDPTSHNYLSDFGIREFNKYVFGGFEVLLDWFNDKPRSLHAFLLMYNKRLQAGVGDK